MSDDLLALTIVEAAALYRAKRVTPRELVAAHLEHAALDPDLNTMATLLEQSATEDAERATSELAAGGDRGPLHGIPVSLKDNIDVAGARTTAGSRLYADRVAPSDSTIAARLHAAGAVIIGKANMHELALGVQTENELFGQTRNPWDLTRIPGGSSGGSAAAVSAGIGLASIGTDSGGSIRVPAALCGVVGLKPTHGRVSNFGVIVDTNLAWRTGEHHLYLSAALTLALKVVFLPWILHRLIRRLQVYWDTEPLLNISGTMLIGYATGEA